MQYYTPIGKGQEFEYCGMYFELSENIERNSNVILVSYKHNLLLLSIKSDEELDLSLIGEFIPTMFGFLHIKNSPIGKIDYDFIYEKNQIYVDVSYVPLVVINLPGCVYINQIPSVVLTDSFGNVFSFTGVGFEHNLRGIKSSIPFVNQINRLVH